MEYRFTIIDGEVQTVIDEPIGWDKCKITVARDEKVHGLFVSYTDDLEFVNSGYTIIANAFYTYGVEYILKLKIEQRCNKNYDYETLYTGRINLSGFQDKFNIYCSCLVNIEQDNSSMLIKNNGDKQVNFSGVTTLTDVALAPLYPNYMDMHSKAIVLTSVFEDAIELSESIDHALVDNINIAMPLWLLEKSDDLDSEVESDLFFITRNVLSNPLWWVDISQFKTKTAGEYKVKYNIKSNTNFTVDSRPFYMSIVLCCFKNGSVFADITTPVIVSESPVVSSTYSQDWEAEGELTMTLDVNDYVSFFYRVSFEWILGGTGSTFANWVHSSQTQDVEFKVETTTAASTAKTYMVHECFERTAQNVLDKEIAFKSNFLGRKDLGYGSNGLGSFMAITNGFNIRTFDKPILSTFNEMYSALSTIHCLGLGIEDDETGNEIIRVEPVKYFYSDTNLGDILNVKQLSVNVDLNKIYNTAKIGFEKEGTEEGTDKNNTLDGFATMHNYNLPITTVKKEFVNVCRYIADHYAIEFTRRVQFFDTSTASWKFDDDNFVICTKRTENELGIATELNLAEKNENFSQTNNILSPETGYNLRCTPSRMLLNWNQVISAPYAKIAGKKAKFTNGKNNYLFQSALNGSVNDRYNNELLSENQDLAWDDANNTNNSPIFEPISIKFDYSMSSAQFNNLLANKTGYYGVGKGGTIEHRGYVKMITFTPVQGMANFDLIRMFGNEESCDLIYVECPYVVDEYVE
jgi:hypothetical protein